MDILTVHYQCKYGDRRQISDRKKDIYHNLRKKVKKFHINEKRNMCVPNTK